MKIAANSSKTLVIILAILICTSTLLYSAEQGIEDQIKTQKVLIDNEIKYRDSLKQFLVEPDIWVVPTYADIPLFVPKEWVMRQIREKYKKECLDKGLIWSDKEYWRRILREEQFTIAFKTDLKSVIEEINGAIEQMRMGLAELERKRTPAKAPQTQPPPKSIQIFSKVEKKDSKAFSARKYAGINIETKRWDTVPYHLTEQYKGTINVLPGQRCILAGDAAGTKDWEIDNFLFIEVQGKSLTKRFIYGHTEGENITYNGVRVDKIGENKFSFKAGEDDLAENFPDGTTFQVTISALDYGGVGFISDVYLIIVE